MEDRWIIKDYSHHYRLGDAYVDYLVSGSNCPKELVFYISGIGLDRYDFKEHLLAYDLGQKNPNWEDLPMPDARHYALTVPGFEKCKQFEKENDKPGILIQAELVLCAIQEIYEKYDKVPITLYGFSYGADLIINMLYSAGKNLPLIDRIILNDYNGSKDSAFITSKLQTLDVSKEDDNFNFLNDLVSKTFDAHKEHKERDKQNFPKVLENILTYSQKIILKDGLQIKKSSIDAVHGADQNNKKLYKIASDIMPDTTFQIYMTNGKNLKTIEKYFVSEVKPAKNVTLRDLPKLIYNHHNSPVPDHFWFTKPYGIRKLLSEELDDNAVIEEAREETRPFRILTLDGGGIRGVYTAQILKHIKKTYKINFSDYFDLIAGTSTGAILAAALATDKDIDEVIELYEKQSKSIFSSKLCKLKLCKLNLGLFLPKYSKKELSKQLKSIFKDEKIEDAKTRLMILTTDIANGLPHVITECDRDNEIDIADALLASIAAPVYFRPVKLNGKLLADGGIWCNNPSLYAAAEARINLSLDLSNIHVLSIGTMQDMDYFSIKNYNRPFRGKLWGFLGAWRSTLIDMLLNLQSLSSEETTRLLKLGRYIRINSEMKRSISLDDVGGIEDCSDKAQVVIKRRSGEIAEFFKK